MQNKVDVTRTQKKMVLLHLNETRPELTVSFFNKEIGEYGPD